MPDETAHVDWHYRGKPDFLFGTGATPAERAFGYAGALVGAGLFINLFLVHALPWSGWQYLVAGLIASDLFGGIVTNSLNSTKRLYHSPILPQDPGYAGFFKNHLAFTALHVYPLLIALLYAPHNYIYGVFWYAYLLLAAIIILNVPLYLRRPAAFLAISLALVVNIYFVLPAPGFEWLAPALMIKILYGALMREEPYRPISE